MRPATLLLAAVALSGCERPSPADLVIIGRVWTGDSLAPRADAIAIRGDREALRAYTSGVAYAHFREGQEGVLRPGMLADVVVINRDITADPVGGIDPARVVATVLGGKVVYTQP